MKINDMKRLFTILAILSVSAIFAQTPKKMVLIPDYVETYEFRFDQEIEVEINGTEAVVPVLPEYTRRSNDIFVIGNFNRLTIIRPMIDIPRTTVNNNNAEYIKTTQFNPDKSLQEILRDDKK